MIRGRALSQARLIISFAIWLSSRWGMPVGASRLLIEVV
jgi:hypothetical protein